MSLKPEIILENFFAYNTEQKSANLLLKTVEAYQQRNLSHDWLHTGRLSMPITELITIINKLDQLPARTGHLGNWQEIAAGRGCALDHNQVVCGKRNLAYPLIYDLNQTENTVMDSGDVVYLPGSLINKHKRTHLPLFTWNGHTFCDRSKDVSYFVPFVMTPAQGQLVPLTEIHKQYCRFYKSTKFASSIIIEQSHLVKLILKNIFEYIIMTENCPVKLSDIIDRIVTIDGRVLKAELNYTDKHYKISNSSFSDTHALIEAIFLPLHAAHNANYFRQNIKTMPKEMPFLSLAFSCTLDYVLHHYPDPQLPQNQVFNVHFEWGAFDSAGYPPRVKGYYKQKVRLIKNIYQIIIKLFPEIKPVFFVLLPSAVFNLLPNNAYPADADYVNELFTQLKNKTNYALAPDLLMQQISQIVMAWFKQYKTALSAYYLGRFVKRRCIHHQTLYHEYGEATDLESFNQLTLQQACMTLGALHEIASKDSY